MTNKRNVLFIAILVGLTLGLYYFVTIREPTENVIVEPITIGVINGPLSRNETNIFLARLAENHINQYCQEKNISYQFKFEISPASDKSSIVLNFTEEFHQRGIDLVVGYPWDTMFWPARHYANNTGMVIISTGSDQLEVGLRDSCYRLRPNNPHIAYPTALCARELGVTHVITVSNPHNSVSSNIIDAFIPAFNDLGGNVTLQFPFNSDKIESFGFEYMLDELDEEVSRLLGFCELDEIAVVYEAFGIEKVLNAVGTYSQLMDIKWIIPYLPLTYDVYFEEERDLLASYNITLVGLEPVPTGPKYEEISKLYVSEFDSKLSLESANLYDGCWILALSVMEAGSANASLVNEVVPIVAGNYTGASGKCQLDSNGDRISLDYGINGLYTVDGEAKLLRCGTYQFETTNIEWTKNFKEKKIA